MPLVGEDKSLERNQKRRFPRHVCKTLMGQSPEGARLAELRLWSFQKTDTSSREQTPDVRHHDWDLCIAPKRVKMLWRVTAVGASVNTTQTLSKCTRSRGTRNLQKTSTWNVMSWSRSFPDFTLAFFETFFFELLLLHLWAGRSSWCWTLWTLFSWVSLLACFAVAWVCSLQCSQGLALPRSQQSFCLQSLPSTLTT